jgi:DHHC palmitoyltransferase
MVATEHDKADIVVVLLKFASLKLDFRKLSEGIHALDREGLSVAHIAIKYCSIASLSALLHMHPTLIGPDDDKNVCRSLISELQDDKYIIIAQFLTRYYPNIAEQMLPNQNNIDDAARTDAKNSENCAISAKMLCNRRNDRRRSRKIPFGLLYFLGLFSNSLIFISIGIAFFITAYILMDTIIRGNCCSAATLRLYFGCLSLRFIWLLYSKLCSVSAGSVKAPTDLGLDIPRDIHVTGRDEYLDCTYRTYDDALNMIYSTSEISRNKNRPVLHEFECKTGSSMTGFCCHYCRSYQPYGSAHSSKLGVCIPNYDHYCVFLKNHVGRDNYPYYVGSLVAAVGFVMPLFMINLLLYNESITDGSHSSHQSEVYHRKGTDKSLPHSGNYTGIAIPRSIHILCSGIYFAVTRVSVYFLQWSFAWWIVFILLLLFHVYLMCMNLTTRQYVKWYEEPNSKGFKHRYNALPSADFITNICDRLFPTVNDVCYTRRSADLSRVKSKLSWSCIRFRLFRACFDVWSGAESNGAAAASEHDIHLKSF